MVKKTIICISIVVCSIAIISTVGYRQFEQYKTTIADIQDRNERLIKLNSDTKKYNNRLKSTITEYEQLITEDYKQFEDGLGIAGDNIEEIGKSIDKATEQISRIIDTISKLIEEIGDL